MREIGAFEAKNKFSALLDAVLAGEEVTITRRGRPVAKLVRHDAGADPQQAVKAGERLRAMRRGVTLGGLSIREMIEEGRQ